VAETRKKSNGFTGTNCILISFCVAVASSLCVKRWSRRMTSAFIVMRVCRSCGRDVIATVYRLRVVIATPRIELGDFRCNTGLIEICVPDAAQAGHADCGFRLPQSMAVDYCSMRVMRTRRSDPAVGPAQFFDQLIFSGSVSQLQKRANAPRMGSRKSSLRTSNEHQV